MCRPSRRRRRLPCSPVATNRPDRSHTPRATRGSLRVPAWLASWLEDEGVFDVGQPALGRKFEAHDVRADAALDAFVVQRCPATGLRALDDAVAADHELDDQLAADAGR